MYKMLTVDTEMRATVAEIIDHPVRGDGVTASDGRVPRVWSLMQIKLGVCEVGWFIT